jgi:PAS domain S-box-containing protein
MEASRSHEPHVVQFYEDDSVLCDAVGDFLAIGLEAGEPIVVIARESHRDGFQRRLRAKGIDVEQAIAGDRLILLDAHETLASFMADAMPDWDRFRATIAGVLARSRAACGERSVRAYGEMVDILWQDGHTLAALRLEEMWNDLAQEHHFSLFCAYSLPAFVGHPGGLDQVCDRHSSVIPISRTDAYERRLRELREMDERNRVLVAEIERRKMAEAELRRSRQELADSLDNAVTPMHWVGAEGTVLWANQAELELLGYTREEYVGRQIAEFHVDQEAIEDILTRLSRGETLRGYEARLRAKDGAIRHVLIDSNGYWRDGKFIHSRCFTRDITDQKRAESARDEFLAMLGHELRNPLSPILTALQLMRLRSGDGSAKERAVIERQVQHLVRLVDDLLDVSRITRGKLELKKRSMEVSEVVAHAIEMASPLIEQRRHRLEVEVHRFGLRVRGDEHRLSQVVSNLLVNAAKYTEPGGQIDVIGRRDGGEVVLEVRDTGIGIAPDLLPHVFEMFVQGQRALDRSQGGLGLGLAICHSLVSLHDGTITASSPGIGQGSTVTIRLPLEESWVERPAPVGSLPEPSPHARRILVVDDNADAAELLAEALAGGGHITRVAHDGPSAILVAAEFKPDVAFLDIGLPVMDGYELARRLRDLPGLAGIKLLALTGYGQASDRTRALSMGFDVHLVKPVELERIEAEMDRLFPKA